MSVVHPDTADLPASTEGEEKPAMSGQFFAENEVATDVSAADSTREPLWVPARTMARYDREQLYADVWAMPIRNAATKHGMGESTLSKVCERLFIPTPPSGHWSKVAAGKPVAPIAPLPSVRIAMNSSRSSIPGQAEKTRRSEVLCARAPKTAIGSSHGILLGLLERYDRNRLFDDVWTTPIRLLAPRYGVSNSALRKTCLRLDVPIPPRGYWNKVAAGKSVPARPELPSIRDKMMIPRHPRNRVFSAKEQNRVLVQIAKDISAGESLSAACQKAGIQEKTYRRWHDRKPASLLLDDPDAQTEESKANTELSGSVKANENYQHHNSSPPSLNSSAPIGAESCSPAICGPREHHNAGQPLSPDPMVNELGENSGILAKTLRLQARLWL